MEKELSNQLEQLTTLQRIAYQEGYKKGYADKEKELLEEAQKDEVKLNELEKE